MSFHYFKLLTAFARDLLESRLKPVLNLILLNLKLLLHFVKALLSVFGLSGA